MLDSHFELFLRQKYDERENFILDTDKPNFDDHFKKWNFFDYSKTLHTTLKNPGQIFLYEKYEDKRISYPQIGIFINYLPCDQTLDIEWVSYRRTWEHNQSFEYTPEDKPTVKYDFYDMPSFIRSMPQWSDYMLIYGVWDKLPDWKTLRRHYELTWWFHKPIEESRDIKLNFLLKD
jgi:hypothetical protein